MLRRAALLSSGLTSAGVKNGVIQDDWDVINEIAKAGRASDFYSIGDKKSLSWGWQGVVDMILVGINADTKTSGGKANMTWMASATLCKKVYYEKGFATVGYDEATYKQTLIAFYTEGLISLLPKNLQDAIVEVQKTSATYNGSSVASSTKSSNHKIWIPSVRELGFSSSDTRVVESSGPIYSLDLNWITFPPNTSAANNSTGFGFGWKGGPIFLRTWFGHPEGQYYSTEAWGGAAIMKQNLESGKFIITAYAGRRYNNEEKYTVDYSLGYVLPCFCL